MVFAYYWSQYLSPSADPIPPKIMNKLIGYSTIFGILICAIPILVYSERDLGIIGDPRDAPLAKGLVSSQFYDSLFASLVVSIPLFVEFGIDSLFTHRTFSIEVIAMWMLLGSVVIPDFLYFFVVSPSQHIYVVQSLLIFRFILTTSSAVLLLSAFGGPVIWNRPSVIITWFSYLFLEIVMSFAPFLQNNTGKILIQFIQPTAPLTILSIGAFVPLLKWIIHIKSLDKNNIQRNDLYCTGQLTGVVLALLALWFVELYFGFDVAFVDRGAGYLTGFNYVLTTYTFIVITAYGRIFRYESTRSHMRREQELDQKRTFVRYVSHEIRTPLNTVLLGLQYLKRELVKSQEGNEGYIEIVDDLRISCDTAVGILNELLDYEKLEAGIMTLDMIPVPAKRFLLHSINPFHIQAKEKKINFKVNLIDEDVDSSAGFELSQAVIHIDKSKFSQVIRNLLSNALKFTKANGSVEVTVELFQGGDGCRTDGPARKPSIGYRVTAPEDVPMGPFRLRITVKDTGPGISKENQGRLFKEIIQFNPGLLQGGAGSGLGLWISNRIIRLHHGEILVQSEGEGFGCDFIVEIPAYFGVSGRDREHDYSVNSRQESGLSLDAIHSHRVSAAPMPSPFISPPSLENFEFLRPLAHSLSVRKNNLIVPGNKIITPTISSSRGKSERIREYKQDTDEEIIVGDHPDAQERITRVLIVDDAKMNQKMLGRLLLGKYDVIDYADDGVLAVEKVKTSIENNCFYSAIIMDFMMPNMNGPQATKLIREMGFKGRVLGVTGNALPSDIELFKAHGADKVVPKPVNFDTLLRALFQ